MSYLEELEEGAAHVWGLPFGSGTQDEGEASVPVARELHVQVAHHEEETVNDLSNDRWNGDDSARNLLTVTPVSARAPGAAALRRYSETVDGNVKCPTFVCDDASMTGYENENSSDVDYADDRLRHHASGELIGIVKDRYCLPDTDSRSDEVSVPFCLRRSPERAWEEWNGSSPRRMGGQPPFQTELEREHRKTESLADDDQPISQFFGVFLARLGGLRGTSHTQSWSPQKQRAQGRRRGIGLEGIGSGLVRGTKMVGG